MRHKFLIVLLVMTFVFCSIVSASPVGEMTMVDKTAATERVIYGSDQTGSLVERVTRLEKDVYGLETKDALMVKVDRLYAYATITTLSAPSMITRLNAVEWNLTHEVSSASAKLRVENLERVLQGNSGIGGLDDRLTKMGKLAFSSGDAELTQVPLPKDTLVKIKITTPLDTKKTRTGDVVLFQVSEDVYTGGVLVIAKGASGIGKVTKVEQARNFGRDAKLEVSFDNIKAMDGSDVPTILGDKAKQETLSLAKATGASIAGMALLGPVGIIGGAFIHGDEVSIPEGSEMYIQTKIESELFGIKVK